MKLLVALETRYYRTPDGSVWTEAQNAANFWGRYLELFREVIVIARVKEVSVSDPKWIRADRPCVTFYGLPYFIGPWQYLKAYFPLKKAIREAVSLCDCAILRGGRISTLAWKELRKQGKKYSVEVCADPWESLAPGTVKSIARPFARMLQTYSLKRQCKQAVGAAYVTERMLQRRYPPGAQTMSTHYSSIEIGADLFRTDHKTFREPLKLLHVGSMETMYKAQDVLIRAVKECIDRGCDISLSLAGDGRCRPAFEALVKELNMEHKVDFLGMLPGIKAVVAELDRSDIFVLPSLVEGLPRALIEAMARRLPCIATHVGGIPELLKPEAMVEPKNSLALAEKIIDLATNREKLIGMSNENYEKALYFDPDVLRERRRAFYRFLLESVDGTAVPLQVESSLIS